MEQRGGAGMAREWSGDGTVGKRMERAVKRVERGMEHGPVDGAGMEQGWDGNGTGMERAWNRNGTGMEREWNGNGTGNEREWNGDGTGMERDRNRNGTGTEREWNGDGTGMERGLGHNLTKQGPMSCHLKCTRNTIVVWIRDLSY
jgi:hypothetical protein